MSDDLQIRFSGDFIGGLTFVEVENEDGLSVDAGEWVKDGEHWVLKL